MFVSISDPNVCDDGWFLDEATRTCYQATNFEVYNASEAILACKFLRPMGSTLAEPRTVELQIAVFGFIQVLKIRSSFFALEEFKIIHSVLILQIFKNGRFAF